MLHKSDYIRTLVEIGGYNEHIGQAAIYFYHSNVPLDLAKTFITNLKQTLERKTKCGQHTMNGKRTVVL